jgi:hypothetical protein
MRSLLLLSVLICLQACSGTFGGTKTFVLDVDPPPGTVLQHDIYVSSVAVAPGANELDSVGTFHIGKMDASELSNLRQSLEDTIERISWPSTNPLAVHLLMSRYYVAHSNNDGAVLACVDWALVSDQNDVAFAERFFVSVQASDVEGLNTLGKVKNILNAQIVQRIAEYSLEFSAQPDASPGADIPHTYATAETAAAPLPDRLTSLMGLTAFSTKGVDWAGIVVAEEVDWSSYLERMQ